MKKRKFKDNLGDIMLLVFLVVTVLTMMFFFIYSFNGINGEEAKKLLILGTIMLLSLSGYIFSLDWKE